MIKKFTCSGLLLLPLLVCFSCRTLRAGIIRDDVYQDDGFNPFWKLAQQQSFQCVGTFIKPNGVWIGDRYVLTVAHGFVKPNGQVSDMRNIPFRLFVNGREYQFPSKRIYIPRAYIDGVQRGGRAGERHKLTHDIAVVELVSPLRFAGVSPAMVNSSDKEKDTLAVFVGFGDRGTSATGSDTHLFGSGQGFQNEEFADSPPRPMAFQNTVDGDFSEGWCLRSKFDSNKDIPLLGITAPGDSGGGMFTDIDGQWRLVGINHGGIPRANSGQSTWAKGNTEGSSTLSIRLSRFWPAIAKGVQGDWTDFTQSHS